MVAVHNAEIADRFDELADLLEIENGNPFRVRAYRNASRMIRQYPQNFAELVAQQADLTALPGIGESLAEHIAEIVASDRFSALEQAKRRTPIALSTLLKIRGLGPSRVRALYRQLNIRSVADLKRAARSGQIRTLEGFGARTEEKILAEVERREQSERRINRLEAREIAQPLVAYLQGIKGVKQVIPAGSYRRCKETVGDIDLLITASRGSGVIDQFTRYGEIVEVISQGGTRSTVRLRSGIQVDVRVVPAVSYGAALHYFTGSKEHNIALRSLAQRKGLKINEYGVFRGEKRIAGRTEQEVFNAIGLPFIEPELRENRGEIEAAREHGVRIAIGTDAHSAQALDYMQFGVDQARRGWLGPGDVLNTRSLKALRSLFSR